MTMRLFAQITKVDEAKRLVYGRACQEVVDRSGEIFDYESSKPYFKAWSEGIAKDTDGKSLGNVRAMHGKVSAGKVTQIDFNDTDKAIDICTKVVDDNEWNKTLEGCYTGFSIGGSYVGDKKTEKIADKDVARYTANPTEISLVDQPCVPTAKFFDIVKADGAVEKVEFKPAVEEIELAVTGTDAEVADFAKALNDSSMTMADAIKAVRDAAVLKANPPTEEHELIKAVRDFLATDSEIEKKLADPALTMTDLVKIADEHLTADELGKIGTPEDTPSKRLDAMKVAIVNKVVAKSAKLQKIHDMLGEMGARCAKVEPAGDLSKGDFAKVVEQLAEAQDAIKKLQAQPLPLRTVALLKTVSKTEDNRGVDLDDEAAMKKFYVHNSDGSINEAATTIKFTQSLGGKRINAQTLGQS